MSLHHSTSFLSAIAVAAGIGLTPAVAADVVLHPPHEKARTQPYSEVGTLYCDISPSIGVIIGSQQGVNCVFKPTHKDRSVEYYTGNITKLGVDLGFTNSGTIAWAVWAPTVRPEGALRGNYVGASANATVGIGAGTNVLTGGSWKTISLQPISVQGQKGLNAAVGLSNLKLDYVG